MAKIVHLTSVATTFHVRIFAKQCRSLAASGNDVTLLCTHDTDCEVEGVKIRTVGKPKNRFHRMTVITARLLRAAIRERADLYVTHDPELTFVAWLLSALGKTVVYDMHENTPKQVLTKSWVPSYLRRPAAMALAAVHRTLLRNLPVVFAESSYAKDYAYVHRSVAVLNMPPRGVPSERYNQLTLGYIGGVTELRGAGTTLEALRLLAERRLCPDFECIGPIDPRCKRQLVQLAEQLPGDIRLRGYMTSDIGWLKIARCHVGLAVLKNIPNYYESFPGKMFEYMSFGLPVIVSNFPLYRDIVDRIGCGLCVDPDSPELLAEAIEWMLTHPKEAHEMGERGRRAVDERYNWDIEYRKLLDFYDDLLSPRNRRVLREGAASTKLAA
jgi:glycosyltransferase involved in cell wall biosynthesis